MAAADGNFLGTGWAFGESGIGLSPAHDIVEASGDAKIRQSIWLILSTSPGERVGRPDFGCGIHDLVFANRTASTLSQVRRRVTEALQRWEPRIDLLGVDVGLHPNDPNGILIQVQYEVRASNSRYNLVYPFYLSR